MFAYYLLLYIKKKPQILHLVIDVMATSFGLWSGVLVETLYELFGW